VLNILNHHLDGVISAVICLILTVFLIWVRRTREFYWTDFWYAFPWFGGLARAIREKNLHPVQDDITAQTITPAQQALIATYFNQIGVITRERFQRAYRFLLLAKQSDRRPTPFWGLPILFLLLLAEALGFGMLLAPFIAAEITPNAAEIIGFAIALVMAIIAAGLTHAAGAEFYESGLIAKMRRIANNSKIPLYRMAIANDEDQEIDSRDDDVTRFGNRVLESAEDKAGRKFIASAFLFILVVLGASSLLRYENLRLAVTQQSALQAQPDAALGSNPFASAGPPEASLPPDVAQSAQDAQNQVQVEEASEQLLGGVAGIIGLGVIFVFTQIYAMTLGIRYGHLERARVQSAYRNGTMGYSSYEDYKRHVLDPRVRRTERRLQQLKNGLFNDSQTPPSTLTFSHWLSVKMQMESAALRAVGSAPGPALALPPEFSAATIAARIMNIADAGTRRVELRCVIATLDDAQCADLQKAIERIRESRAAAPSWVDEV
jgi:hypothetical protein